MSKWTITDIPSQQGKLAVVTGANSGIGWHAALELARAGGEVILAARTEAKGRDAVERIRRELPPAKVRSEVLDLASLWSVRTAVRDELPGTICSDGTSHAGSATCGIAKSNHGVERCGQYGAEED
jgi:NAD(P)-dependent dehydrogenase (short-subunit alcohol dehydrogenase family)